MSVLMACANGNLTSAATWALVDGTSYSNSETSSRVLTTAYSGTRSSAFTPGAITIDGIAVKLSVRTGTTGTITVGLYNSTGAADVAGTDVTQNCSDLPACATADLNGGWIFFKFSAPVLLLAATNYMVQAKTSNASQVSLFGSSSSDLSRCLRTTTTQAPVAGDDFIITKEWTAAGTGTARSVTMDALASSITDYGSASTSLVTPAMAICNGGTLIFGTAAATNYYLRLSGNMIVYSGGTYSKGTTATKTPRDSTAKLNFDCAANVDFGLKIRNLGTWNEKGLSRTSGKDIWYCKLNTDEAANSTSLGVDTDTGWLDNDEIAVASTSRTASQSEKGTMNGAAGASSLTVDGFAGTAGGLLNAHIGSDPCPAEVILLTRNNSTFGASATLQSFISIDATAIVDIEWSEFYWLGSNTSNKRGIEVGTTTGSFSFQYCSIHDFVVANSLGISISSSAGNITISNFCAFCSIGNLLGLSSGQASVIFSNIILISTQTGGNTLSAQSGLLGTYTNISTIGGNVGINLGGANLTTIGTISNLTARASGSFGINSSGLYGGTISNITVIRAANIGLNISGSDIIFDGVTLIGNAIQNIQFSFAFNITIINLVSNGDTTFSTPNGVGLSSSASNIYFITPNIGTASGVKTTHSTGDIVSGTGVIGVWVFISAILGSTTKVTGYTNQTVSCELRFQNYNNVAGDHRIYKRYGTIIKETTTVHTGGTSLKMTPNSATNKLTSPSFYAAVASGQTVNPSAYVYEDASYNGARSRLILKRNDAIGVTSDTVIDTATAASDAAWEQLTGTTPAASADGVMEFIVDCDGTAGNLFMDSFTVT